MIQVVFENEFSIAVDKPSGMLSIPSRMPHLDTRPCLQRVLEGRQKQPLFAVHRLDFEVSGLLIYAKTPKSHSTLNSWFQNRTINKTYEALTEGNPPQQKHFQWTHRLLRGKKRTFTSPYGKIAETEATWLEVSPHLQLNFQLWNLFPKTGRAHQLRFQLAHSGFPIVGDSLYGSSLLFSEFSAIALRAVKLDFTKCDGYLTMNFPPQLQVPDLKHWMQTHIVHLKSCAPLKSS